MSLILDRQRSTIKVYVANGKRLMTIESQESKPLPATLARRITHGADAAQIAAAIVSTWKQIDVALTPVLGQQGVAALYKRSLYLTSPVYPWLSGTHEGVVNAMDLSTLESVFAQQSSAAAAAGGNVLLQTFYEVLTSLVGPSLTERLLRSVWEKSSSGSSAQDTSP